MNRWDEVRAVAWDRLEGAYGTDRDVAEALETLRFGRDADDDAFSDAWLDVLFGHVWHQGTIYPVTASVLPFVFDVVDSSPALRRNADARQGIAMFVPLVAAATRNADGAVRDDVQRALGECAPRLRAWLGAGLASEALAAMLHVPALAPRVLAGEEAPRADVLSAILQNAQLADPHARAWAAGELARVGHPVTERAREILAKDPDEVDAGRLEALAGAVGSAELLDALRERFGLKVELRMNVPGETSATITVSDDDWFVVQTTRNVTIRWRAHPFVEGDLVVLVDIDARNVPREVRGTGDKAHFSARFDDRGSLVPPRL